MRGIDLNLYETVSMFTQTTSQVDRFGHHSHKQTLRMRADPKTSSSTRSLIAATNKQTRSRKPLGLWCLDKRHMMSSCASLVAVTRTAIFCDAK
jgi:hypothetical protein